MCQSLCKTKFQKKILFWGLFPDIFAVMFPFPGYVFTLCFLGGPRRPAGRPKNHPFFGHIGRRKKWHFFGRRKTMLFGSSALFAEHGYHISPQTTGLNLESAEIRTSKLSKQQMSKSIQQFLKCTLISSPLFRWKWPTQVGTLGTLCWGWELGMLQIHLWIHGPIIIPFNMTLSEWMLKVFMWERMPEDMSEKMSKKYVRSFVGKNVKRYLRKCLKLCQKICQKNVRRYVR